MSELWTPADGPATKKVWRCFIPGCEVTYSDGAERQIIRHMKTHDDEIEAVIHMRKNEPLSITDTEQVAWLKADAEKRRDVRVKGVTGWTDYIKRKDRADRKRRAA